MSDMRLDSVDGIIRKLGRPDYVDDTTNETLPDVVACNFDNPQLAAALLGQASMEASAEDDN